jgi:hypothetical protein
MPVVPFNSVPHVNPTPLQVPRLSPNAPAEAFGGGIAAQKGTLGDLSGLTSGAQRIADESHRIALQAKQEADQIAFTHAYGALTNGTTDLLHGPNGVLNKKGSDAFDAPEDVQDGFAELSKGIRAGLSNDTQREIFDKAVQNEWARVNEQTQQHVARERQIYDAQGTDALVEAKRVEAVRSYQNPDVVDNAIETQQAAIADHLRRQGAPDDLIANKKAEVASDTRFQVLQQMVDNHQDLAATAYLAKYRDEFVGRNLTQAETLVNRSSVEGEAQRQTDGIIKTATGLMDGLQQAATIQEPEVRKAAEQRLRQHFSDVAAADREKRAQARQSLGTVLEQNRGDLSSIRGTKAWTLDLNDTDRTALEHRADQIRNPVERGNDALSIHWRQMSALNPSTQAAFLAEDFSSDQYKDLSVSQRNWLISRQIQLRKGTGGTPGTDKSVMRKEETAVIRQGRAAEKSDATRQALEKAAPGASKYLPAAPVVTIPKWMADSAAHDSEYRDYLKMNGVQIPDQTNGPPGNIDLNNPPRPKVPGAPIVRPPAQAPAPAPAKKKGVNIIRDSSTGRPTRLEQD